MYMGNFHAGERHGPYVHFYTGDNSGVKVEGTMRFDQPSGDQVTTYSDGRTVIQQFDGKKPKLGGRKSNERTPLTNNPIEIDELEFKIMEGLTKILPRHMGRNKRLMKVFEKFRDTHLCLPEMVSDAQFQRNPKQESLRKF